MTPGAEPALLVDQVEDRGEVHRVGDDPGPTALEVERAEDDGVRQRDVGLEDHFARPGADQRGEHGRPGPRPASTRSPPRRARPGMAQVS